MNMMVLWNNYIVLIMRFNVVILMAISVLKKISEKDACSILLKQEQELSVVNIDEIKESTRQENQYYCYVDFKMQDGTQFGASYSFYLEDEFATPNSVLFSCGTSSKLYYLLKGFLDLNPLTDVGLTFQKTDIDEILLNKKFVASAIVQSVGGKTYPYIVCKKVIE